MLILLIACANIEPAPEDIDGLAHYLWQNYDNEGDEELALGIENLHIAIDGDTLSEIHKGSISRLSSEELEAVGKNGGDAKRLHGVYFANIIPCSLEFAEESIYSTNQDELHPGDYVRYDRSYTSDFDAYTAREENVLNWETNYEVDGLGYSYEAWLDSSMRYLSNQDPEYTTLGPAFFSRGLLREPAYFDEDSTDRGMIQDFQMEVYWERSPNELVHFYFIWREMIIFGDTDFSSETIQDFVLEGLSDWDSDMAARCEGS
jgi:hypothetical protein